MGAVEFEQYGFGKDSDAAFDSCVRQAHYEHGHDSYNGTISTVSSHRTFSLPARANHLHIADLVWKLYDTDDETYPFEWADPSPLGWLPKGLEASQVLEMVASIEKWESCCGILVTGTAARKKREQRGWKGLHGDVYYFFGLAAC